jgi:hypothetical protein
VEKGLSDRSVWQNAIQNYRGSQRRKRTAETPGAYPRSHAPPTDGTTHWSSYRLAKELGITQSSVSPCLAPFRYSAAWGAWVDGERCASEFEEKAADIIGLYLKPPVNAAVFCVDSEKRYPSTRPT